MFTKAFTASFLIEFGPVLLFFYMAREYGIFAGTASLVGATIAALVWSFARDRRIPVFTVLSSTFVLTFGVATLISHNPYWVVIEYTLYNGLFGLTLLVGLLFGKPLLKPLFETMFHISDLAWGILSLRWSLLFIATAIGNELVWRLYGEDQWVNFRLLSALILGLFAITQIYLAREHRLPHASEWGLRK